MGISPDILPKRNTISSLSRPNKIKRLDDFVFMIKCSNSTSSKSSAIYDTHSDTTTWQSVSISNPHVASYNSTSNSIVKVTADENKTIVEFKGNNENYSWITIDPNIYILADDKKYKLLQAEGIGISPNKTNFSTPNNDYHFKLVFPARPKSTSVFDIIETPDSEWKYYGIRIR